MSVMVRFLALSVCDNYSKSSIKSFPGAYLFETHMRVGLIRDGGLFKRWGGGEGRGLLNLAKKVVSVLHKELEYQVEKFKYRKLEVMQVDQKQIRTSSW